MKLSPRFLLAFMLAALLLSSVIADPNGPIVLNNYTQNAPVIPAASMTTVGGSFTTLLLNATSQTMRWKAYVGNVTGKFALSDANNATIYDWNLTSIAGKVYASRNTSINWPSIRCASNATMQGEQYDLNMSTSKVDSINRTFNQTVHRGFYVGTTFIGNSTCRAIATYVNGVKQAPTEAATFQEVLLDDTQRVVYTTMLENKATGYNNAPFDFQMIVAESDINPLPQQYYFWVELN